jgi:hypothetical protein
MPFEKFLFYGEMGDYVTLNFPVDAARRCRSRLMFAVLMAVANLAVSVFSRTAKLKPVPRFTTLAIIPPKTRDRV